MNSISQNLKTIREEKGISFPAIEVATAISQRNLKNYETGESKIPVVELVQLIKLYDIACFQIYEDKMSSTELRHNMRLTRILRLLENMDTSNPNIGKVCLEHFISLVYTYQQKIPVSSILTCNNEDTHIYIGNHLCAIRERKGSSQKEIAKQADVSQQSISNVEKGCKISWNMLKKLSRIYGYSVSYLMTGMLYYNIPPYYRNNPKVVQAIKVLSQLPEEQQESILSCEEHALELLEKVVPTLPITTN